MGAGEAGNGDDGVEDFGLGDQFSMGDPTTDDFGGVGAPDTAGQDAAAGVGGSDYGSAPAGYVSAVNPSDAPEESGGFGIGLFSTLATVAGLVVPGLSFVQSALLGLAGRGVDYVSGTGDALGTWGSGLVDSYSTDDIGPTDAPEGAGTRRASGAGPSNLRAIPPARSATSVARDEEAALRTAARQRRARAVARSPVASTLGSTGGTATIKTLLGA